ncbi:MAG: hypothetical protein RL748_2654 [Pseudomonadota bacterium]
MKRTRIKICGFTREHDIAEAVEAGVDALGLVFYPKSARYVTPERAAQLVAGLPPFVNVVGLFVNASASSIEQVLQQVPLSMLQFHGDESLEQCCALAHAVQRPFMQAQRILPDTDPNSLLQCDQTFIATSRLYAGLLLDTHVEGYGGAGKVFDWSLIPKELAPRVVLSGGLNVHNITDAVQQVRPYAVDVSSGVESGKGIKDAALMRAFVAAVRAANFQA